MLYSESTGGFYSRSVNGAGIPVDAVEITSDQYDSFVVGLSNGFVIRTDEFGNLVMVDPPLPTDGDILSKCKDDLACRRGYEARCGVVVNGVAMQTDKDSIAAMDQYATESMMNGLTVVHWEKADGTFHDWPIADFKKLFSEITKYINECFGRQKVLLDEINAAADPQTVDISTGWPSKTITFV